MTIKTAQCFTTTDDQVFFNEAEARAHQSGLDNAAQITAFLDVHYPKPAQGKSGPARAMAGKAVALWLAQSAEGSDE
jgi:hypothetical protein